MRTIKIMLFIFTLSIGCSDDNEAAARKVERGDGDDTTYGEKTDVVVTAGRDGDTYIVTGDAPDDEGCIELDDVCVEASDIEGRYCEEDGAQADILVDENGDVISVVCYPPADDGTPVQELTPDADGNVELPQNQNGTVLTFNEDSDGEPIEGDLTLEAERTTLYGNGVDETILAGNLTVASNNSRARGLTVQGDVSFAQNSNNSAITFCRIEGNLSVESNDFTSANCVIFGDVDVTGNGASLVNLGVQGEWNVSSNANCQGCYSFEDEDEDGQIAEEEVGDELVCGENS